MEFILPMFSMFLLTQAAALAVFLARVQAVRQREARIDDFKVLDLGKATPYVARTTRHFANLFEMPLLFYVACLIALSVHVHDCWALGAAWAYVGLRVAHTLIHLSYNRVRHRLAAFMLSNVALFVLWLRVVLEIGPVVTAH